MKSVPSNIVKTISRDSPFLESVKTLWRRHADTLDDYLAYHATVFAPSEKQVLKNYREVPLDILEDGERLTLWARKAAQG